MAQRGFVTKFMLSCACADCASLAAAQSRVSLYGGGTLDIDTDADVRGLRPARRGGFPWRS